MAGMKGLSLLPGVGGRWMSSSSVMTVRNLTQYFPLTSSSSSSSSSSCFRRKSSSWCSHVMPYPMRKRTFSSSARPFSGGIASISTSSTSAHILLQSRRRFDLFQLQPIRCMNRNARRPKKSNHGKRPCSHARRHEKRRQMKSRGYANKIFGFW